MVLFRKVKLIALGLMALINVARADIIDFAQFEKYIQESLDEWNVPGAAIAVVKDGKVVYIKGFGAKIVGNHKDVSPATVFPLASVTKTFTVMVICRLVDEGKLNWDDKVRTYYPDFSLADEQASAEFTIKDLLCHRSGLPGYAADTLVELGWSPEDTLASLHKIPLKNAFRSAYDYQNIFPGIAGIIIEKVTGKPLSEVYDEYIFKPLGLQETTIGDHGLTGGESWLTSLKAKWRFWRMDVSGEHHPIDGKPVWIKEGNSTIYKFEGSRGVNASARDLAQWMIFLLNDGKMGDQSLVSAAQITETRTPQVKVGPPQGGRLFPKDRVPDIDYGLGWFIHKFDRMKVLSHMGGMTGTRSLIAISPEENVGIVIISNMGGMRVSLFPEAIRSKFFDLYLNLPDQRDWSKELLQDFNRSRKEYEKNRQNNRLKNPLPSKDLAYYAGVYENDLYGKVEIILEGDKLVLKYRDLPKTMLTHWNGDNFTFKAYELTRAYSGNDLGEVSFGDNGVTPKAYGLVINLFHEGKDTMFARVEG